MILLANLDVLIQEVDGVSSHPPFVCSIVHDTIGIGLSALASHPIVQYNKVHVATSIEYFWLGEMIIQG